MTTALALAAADALTAGDRHRAVELLTQLAAVTNPLHGPFPDAATQANRIRAGEPWASAADMARWAECWR
jgi:hypothetical protein